MLLDVSKVELPQTHLLVSAGAALGRPPLLNRPSTATTHLVTDTVLLSQRFITDVTV